MTLFRHVLVTGTLLFLTTLATAQSNSYPVNWKELPVPFHTPSVRNSPEVVPRPEGAKLQLPPGFVAKEYMAGFVRPRFMLLGPGTEILLADSGSRDEADGIVYVLHNGSKTAIIEKLDRPYGLALRGDWLYVAGTTSVKRYRYDAKTMRITGTGDEIVSLENFSERVTGPGRSCSTATRRSCT